MDVEDVGFLLIGIDGGSYTQLNEFIEAGRLKNLSELITDGALLEMEPCVPVDTPTNWATISTGSCSLDHGIVSFTTHIPGEDPVEGQYLDRTMYSDFCLSEFLWESMNRQGVLTAVINYPVSWPARDDRTILVGGIAPGGGPWKIHDGILFSTEDGVKFGNNIKDTRPSVRKIVVKDDHMEIAHPVLGTIMMTISGTSATLTLSGRSITLRSGEWSGPVRVKAQGREAFLKLKILDIGPGRATVYFSQIFASDGWSNPPSLAIELDEAGIPYIEGETPYLSDGDKSPFGPIDIDMELALEYARAQSDWFVKAAALIRRSTSYKGLVLHNHLVDTVNHTLLAALEPSSPFYDEDKAKKAYEIYDKVYGIIDDMIGKFRSAHRNWYIVITSDHSALPSWRYVSLEHALIEEGLMRYEPLGNGKLRFDRDRSSVFIYHDSKQIWVNLKGREPHGIVDKRDYEDVLKRVEGALYSIKDPEDNSRIIKLVVRRDLWGGGRGESRFGDLLYFLRPGYSDWDGSGASIRFDLISESRAREVTKPLQYVSGHHTVYLPTERYGNFTNGAFTIFSGKNVKEFRGKARLMDIAPTISHLMGVSPPRNSRGRLLYEILRE
jgi:predicted AlkP superfamily phosphohydrolase/phosphomutase